MSDKIGAGVVTLSMADAVDGTYTSIGVLYDPLPAVDDSRESLDDTNTGSDNTQSKPGIRTLAPMEFKVKTDAAGVDAIKTAYADGATKYFQYAYPSSESGATSGVKTVTLTGWINKTSDAISLKDETFITFGLNINAKS